MTTYKSWLSNLASNENATALSGLIKQAVSQVESGIDRVLDIQPATAISKQSLSTELGDYHNQEPHGSPSPTVSSTLRSLQSTFNSAFTAPAAPAAQQESSTSHSHPPSQSSIIPVTDDFFASLLGDVLTTSSPKNAAATPTSLSTSIRPPLTAAAALSPLMPRSSEAWSPGSNSNPKTSVEMGSEKLVDESKKSESTAEKNVEAEKGGDETRNIVVDTHQTGDEVNVEVEKAKNKSDTGDSINLDAVQPEESSGTTGGIQTLTSSLETSFIPHESHLEDQKLSSPFNSDSQITSETPTGSRSPKPIASPLQTQHDLPASNDSTGAASFSEDVKQLEVVVAQREQQLMNAMLANTSLNETMSNLKSQLEALTAQKQRDVADHEKLVKDLTARLEETNRLLAVITKVRADFLWLSK
ncbi:hypothetical protein BJ742DRAFT_502379 [Cladochytrium replicatum]|nr:hypothetical protein BJ742DRAFT_502379 [Cladochytrium replicatum]